jgi:hypothetical protein
VQPWRSRSGGSASLAPPSTGTYSEKRSQDRQRGDAGNFRKRVSQYWADYGLTKYQKAMRDGRPLPPPEPHHYRTCDDEFCGEALCEAYREGLADGRAENDLT